MNTVVVMWVWKTRLGEAFGRSSGDCLDSEVIYSQTPLGQTLFKNRSQNLEAIAPASRISSDTKLCFKHRWILHYGCR